MNVGGLPGAELRNGFMLVIGLMAIITAAQVWYFWRKGWFD